MSSTFRYGCVSVAVIVLMLASGCSEDVQYAETSSETTPISEEDWSTQTPEEAERERSDRLTEHAIEQSFQILLDASSTPDERLSLTMESACNFKLTENGSFSSFYHTLYSNAWDDNWYVRPESPWPHRLIDGMSKFCPDQVVPADYYSRHG